jgi:PAS domain S-box-containing protein
VVNNCCVHVYQFAVVLYSIDNDGIFTLWKERRLEALGLKADEVVGKSIFEVFRDYPDILENMRYALAGEEVTWTGEFNGYVYETEQYRCGGRRVKLLVWWDGDRYYQEKAS